ncbi:MAG TPA: Bax inhibitor-1 family protein [Pyrinomonadaceae bacterium]|jgi:FtsH-binding integral membrane protein|nr:Bax inhibitor-1 family protein [Pyrinomonadaceae bacterium]
MSTGYTDHFSSYSAADAQPDVRAAFIRKTYLHLAGAILAFVAIEFLLMNSPIAAPLTRVMFSGRLAWLVVLAAFMGVSYLANWWANSQTSTGMQYLGLGLYVVAEAVIFLPLLFLANLYFPGAILSAGFLTLLLFVTLTATVFITRKDFSFLGPILMIGGFVALGAIGLSLVIGFNMGIIFSAVMVLFAGGTILYNTSNVLHRFNPDQHVAASLALFASVALLFWYILQLFMSRR